MKPLLLACPSNEMLTASLREALAAESMSFAMRQFPDKET